MTFIQKIKLVWRDKYLRSRLLFIAYMLVLFRLMAAIPIPGVDQGRLADLMDSTTGSFLGFLNLFSGGGIAGMSIVLLGVGPYITAAIIMQLVGMMSERVKEMQRESEAGRKKIAMYSRALSVPLAAMQGFGLMTLLQNQGVLGNLTTFEMITSLVVVTAGSVLLMWIGELITEFGIGNGVSLIIFAGIVASVPSQAIALWQNLQVDQTLLPIYVAFALLAFAVIYAIVYITEAERPIPIQYAKQARQGGRSIGGVQTYLPLRINQAGVIPIIFAMSVVVFPQMIASFLISMDSASIQTAAASVLEFLANPWYYGAIYFVLVFAFTYFYTAVTFDPVQISRNLQKSGAFVPGIRPGTQTQEYLGDVMTKITLVGAIFLGVVAVLPVVIQGLTGIQSLAIGGTAILIVVSVVTDLIKKIDSQITMREY